MQKTDCQLCHSNKTALRCDACSDPSCKKCVQFIDEDFFEQISFLPDDLRNKTFCMNCFNQGIDEKIIRFRDVAERALNVDIFAKTQTKETRLIKRIEEPLRVDNCDDRQQVTMKLAFMAAEKGFDTLVDVDITSKKIGEGKSYKKLIWKGFAVPVDPSIKK